MGVLRKSGSGLKLNETAEIGVAEVISEGKVGAHRQQVNHRLVTII
jgi:hypothetical protein